jgi:hypothetical protein
MHHIAKPFIEVELFDGEYSVLAPLDPAVLQPKLQNVDPDFQNMHPYLSSHVHLS